MHVAKSKRESITWVLKCHMSAKKIFWTKKREANIRCASSPKNILAQEILILNGSEWRRKKGPKMHLRELRAHIHGQCAREFCEIWNAIDGRTRRDKYMLKGTNGCRRRRRRCQRGMFLCSPLRCNAIVAKCVLHKRCAGCCACV